MHKKNPALAGASSPGFGTTPFAHHSKPAFRSKRKRVLFALLEGRTGLQEHGVTILRQDEVVPGRFGPVHCCRYRAAPASIELARELLGIEQQREAT